MSTKLPQASPQPLDKGFFSTSAALNTRYPAGKNGWYAIIGTTDTIWIWDADTSAWVDSGIKNTGTTYQTVAAGTPYTLTGSSADIVFGTTSPDTTLVLGGKYLLMARVRIDYVGATFAAVRTVTLKLRRTNNTPADLTNGTTSAKTQIITALSFTMGTYLIVPIVYTATAGDIISIYGGIDVVPTAGSIQVVEADLTALKIA